MHYSKLHSKTARATLTVHSYPKDKRTYLSIDDLINIKFALQTEAKGFRDVKMRRQASQVTRTLMKVSAVIRSKK